MSRRRGHNEGSITQRKDGRWFARLHLGYAPGGKRIRKSFYAPTREAVAEMLTAAKAQHDRGMPVLHGRETIGAYLTSWLESVRPSVKPRTWESYELYVRRHAIPIIGGIRLATLRPEHIRALLARKTKEGMAPRSAAHLRTILRTALQQGVYDRVLAWNPVSAVKPPAVPRYNYRHFEPEEALAFLRAAEDSPAEAPLIFCVALGPRLGEMMGLRWIDCDLEKGTIRVQQTIQRLRAKIAPDGKAGYRVAEPKTDKSRRALEIPEMLLPILRRHRARQAEMRLAAGTAWRHSGLVFTNQSGGPVDARPLRLEFKSILNRAGLPHMRLHDLRHSASTLLLAAGAPLHTVSRLLGHSTIALTSNLYGHFSREMIADAAATMNRVLQPATK
jgi:integrase